MAKEIHTFRAPIVGESVVGYTDDRKVHTSPVVGVMPLGEGRWLVTTMSGSLYLVILAK